MPHITIKDVASFAGVSVGTASMALNDSPKISESTRKKVWEVARKLDFSKNPYARSLSLNQSKTIGFLVTDLRNPYFGEMAGYLQDEINARGYSLMLGMCHESIAQQKMLAENFVNNGIDGMIVVPVAQKNPDLTHIYRLLERKFPLVFISGYYQGLSSNCIMSDLRKGSYELTKYLLETGRTHIVMITGQQDLVPSRERIAGMEQAYAEEGLELKPDQLYEAAALGLHAGYAATKEILARGRPDAITAINDILSMGVLNFLHEASISIPDGIAVAGYDDLEFSRILETPLTTVRQPLQQMCHESVDLLFRLMNGGMPEKEPVRLSPALIVRASS